MLEPYARAPQPDLDVLIAYGVALASIGPSGGGDRGVRARARARSVRTACRWPTSASVYLMAGDGERAAAAFNEALAIDPTLARAHNGLGVDRRAARGLRGGREHWKRAVALDPHDYQALFNLGDVLIRLGRPAEARPYWASYLREAPQGSDEKDRARVRIWLNR